MTTAKPFVTQIGQTGEFFVFPDPPKHPEDKMTSFDHLTITGNAHYLAIHLGNPATTLVAGDRYLALAPTRSLAGVRYPDLLVAFNVDPAAYKARNAYVIEDQGKPPDLVMEIASQRTGRVDVTAKIQTTTLPMGILTGALMRRVSTTARGLATGWRKVCTFPCPSMNCRTPYCKATVPY